MKCLDLRTCIITVNYLSYAKAGLRIYSLLWPQHSAQGQAQNRYLDIHWIAKAISAPPHLRPSRTRLRLQSYKGTLGALFSVHTASLVSSMTGLCVAQWFWNGSGYRNHLEPLLTRWTWTPPLSFEFNRLRWNPNMLTGASASGGSSVTLRTTGVEYIEREGRSSFPLGNYQAGHLKSFLCSDVNFCHLWNLRMRYIYSNNLMGIVVILASGLGDEDIKIEKPIHVNVFFRFPFAYTLLNALQFFSLLLFLLIDRSSSKL